MKRYDFDLIVSEPHGQIEEIRPTAIENEDGKYCLYIDAKSRIAELEAKLTQATKHPNAVRRENTLLKNRIEALLYACRKALAHEQSVIENTKWESSDADDCFALIEDLKDAIIFATEGESNPRVMEE